MELDEDFPDINAAPHIRFERFDRDDDLIIEFDNMFSNNSEQKHLLSLNNLATEIFQVILLKPDFDLWYVL